MNIPRETRITLGLRAAAAPRIQCAVVELPEGVFLLPIHPEHRVLDGRIFTPADPQ